MINKVLAESPLVELEILHPSFDLDLSRQASLKRVAIASSMIDRLPSLANLEELALSDVQEPSPMMSRFPQVLLITLVGTYDAVFNVDASMNTAAKIHITVTSPSQRLVHGAKRTSAASASRLTTSSSLASITFVPDASWTNATLTSALCSTDSSSVQGLTLDCPAALPWFELPLCVSAWPVLSTIAIDNCLLPNLNYLPPSLISLSISSSSGSWTKAEAGIVSEGDPTSTFFDWSWLANVSSLRTLALIGNFLSGTFPNEYSHPSLTSLMLGPSRLNSTLIGPISPNWFFQFPHMTTLIAASHRLNGTIPYYGLEKVLTLSLGNNQFTHWPPLVINSTAGFGAPTQLMTLVLSSNNLVQIPLESDFQLMNNLQFLLIENNPSISGPFPNIFATTVPRTSTALVSGIYASGCMFNGSLPAVPEYQIALYNNASLYISLLFNDNAFSGTIPDSWSVLNAATVNLRGNPGLTGTLATIDENGRVISQFLSSAAILLLDNPGFTGPMFNISAMSTLKNLNLKLPNVDFCASGYSFPSTSLTACSLVGNATNCINTYPSLCTLASTPIAPTASLDPINPIFAPGAIQGCPLPSPGSTFVCTNGVWVSIGPVTETIISLPPASITIVNGNLSTNSIVFASTSSTINVTGCITTLDGKTPRIVVILTQADLEEIVKLGGIFENELIRQGEGCHAISASAVEIDSSGIKSCKTVKTDKIGSPSGLAITFRVNTSKCNVWWIVLVSVLCVVAIVVVVVVIVVFKVLNAKKLEEERHRLS